MKVELRGPRVFGGVLRAGGFGYRGDRTAAAPGTGARLGERSRYARRRFALAHGLRSCADQESARDRTGCRLGGDTSTKRIISTLGHGIKIAAAEISLSEDVCLLARHNPRLN